MRFARISAAVVTVILLLTPLSRLLHEAAALLVSYLPVLQRWDDRVVYAGVLVGVYALLVLGFWGSRFVAQLTEQWQSSGLVALDNGIHGSWAYRAAWLLGAAVVASAALTHGADRFVATAEALVAAVGVVVALSGQAPEVPPLPEYDPLPAPPTTQPEPPPSPANDDAIPLVLSWYFHREPGNMSAVPATYAVQLQASKARYEELRQRDHAVRANTDYVRFVRDGLTPEVGSASRQIREVSQRDRLNSIGEINNVLAFAQRFKYMLDAVDRGVAEYPKYPLETLVDDQGDCEDHAILAAACLHSLGYDARLVDVDHGSGPGHMALAVAGVGDLPGGFFVQDSASRQRYYYCEVSTDAASRDPNAKVFRMGEAPSSARGARLTLLPSV